MNRLTATYGKRTGRTTGEAAEPLPAHTYENGSVCCAAAIMSGRRGQSEKGGCATLIGDERGMAPIVETLIYTLIAIIVVIVLYIIFHDQIMDFFAKLYAPVFDRLNAIFD